MAHKPISMTTPTKHREDLQESHSVKRSPLAIPSIAEINARLSAAAASNDEASLQFRQNKLQRILSLPLRLSDRLSARFYGPDEPDEASMGSIHHKALILREKHVSLEDLNPHPQCPSRKSSSMIAMVNLVATVCGGGVLSLPLCFARAGIVPTTLLMIYAAVATDFSLFVLVACARRTGGRSYGDVAQAAFGSAAQVATTASLGLMLVGTLIAYQVLLRDIWSPVVFSMVPAIQSTFQTLLSTTDDRPAANLLLAVLIVASLPLLLQKDLHALRRTCYVGFFSCILLMMAVLYRAQERVHQQHHQQQKSLQLTGLSWNNSYKDEPLQFQLQQPSPTWSPKWFSTDPLHDIAFVFPIVVLSFFCSYNVLGVHSQLMQPTRKRVRIVLDASMLVCFALFYSVGLGGYLYAQDATLDNILSNFPMDDPAILAGRAGFCLTLMFSTPLVLLPCREALVSIPEQVRRWRHSGEMAVKFQQIERQREMGAHLVINGVDFDESSPLLVSGLDSVRRHGAMLKHALPLYSAVSKEDTVFTAETHSDDDDEEKCADNNNDNDDRSTTTLEIVARDDRRKGGYEESSASTLQEQLVHLFSTVAIMTVTYIVAIVVPGVSTVWSIFGSSMAIAIAFVVPTACYLKIREHKGLNPRAICSWLLLVISCVAAVVCTRNAILNAIYSQ